MLPALLRCFPGLCRWLVPGSTPAHLSRGQRVGTGMRWVWLSPRPPRGHQHLGHPGSSRRALLTSVSPWAEPQQPKGPSLARERPDGNCAVGGDAARRVHSGGPAWAPPFPPARTGLGGRSGMLLGCSSNCTLGRAAPAARRVCGCLGGLCGTARDWGHWGREKEDAGLFLRCSDEGKAPDPCTAAKCSSASCTHLVKVDGSAG